MATQNRFARKEQSLLSDLLKAFDEIESSHKSDIISPKRPIFIHVRATYSGLPSNISTMIRPLFAVL